jgi:hypothetical protein
MPLFPTKYSPIPPIKSGKNNVFPKKGHGPWDYSTAFWVVGISKNGIETWLEKSLQKWIDDQSLQCEAPKIAKLVYNSNNYGLWYL